MLVALALSALLGLPVFIFLGVVAMALGGGLLFMFDLLMGGLFALGLGFLI